MSELRIHRAMSPDGTQIAGRVVGDGPPLVLLPAGPGDSETSSSSLLPYLSEHFTCYLMDTRGRGLSADHPDHSPERLAQDVTAFATSLGEPVGLLQWGDILWAHVATEAGAVAAIAVYEAAAGEAMSADVASSFSDNVARIGELVGRGRLVDAAEALIDRSGFMYTDADLATGAPLDFWVSSAPNLPVFLQELQQAAESEQLGPTDPSALTGITVPVLLLHGSDTVTWLKESTHYLSEHIPDARVVEIEGAAHWGPRLAPDSIAREVVPFFEQVLKRT